MHDFSEIQGLLAQIGAAKSGHNAINSKIAALDRAALCVERKTQHLKNESDCLEILIALKQNMEARQKAFTEAAEHFTRLADLCQQSADALQKLI